MKLSVKIIVALTILMVGCNNDETVKNTENITTNSSKNDWKKDNLVGDVEEIKLYKSSSSDSKLTINSFKKYNQKGFIVYNEYFDNFGKSIQYTKNEFNDENNSVKTITENYLMSSKTISEALFNENNKLISSKAVFDDSIRFSSKHIYNSNGFPISYIAIQNLDTSTVTYQYKYNVAKIIWEKKQQKNKDYSVEYIMEYKYNKDGFITEQTTNTNQKQSGGLSDILSSSADTFDFTYKTTLLTKYNNDNQIIKTSYFEQNQIIKENFFDDYHNTIRTLNYNNGTLHSELKFMYEYDSKGNWMNKKSSIKEHYASSKEFTILSTEKREIKYY